MVEKQDALAHKTYNVKCAFPYCFALALENIPACELPVDRRFCLYHSKPSKFEERHRFDTFVEWERKRAGAIGNREHYPDVSEYVPPPPPVVRISKPKKEIHPTWEIVYTSRAPKGENFHMRKPVRVKAANEEAAKLAFVAKRSKEKIRFPSTAADVVSVTRIERKPRTVRLKQDVLDPFREAGFRTKVQEFDYQQKKIARDTRDKSIGFDGRYTGPDSEGAGITKSKEEEGE